MARDYAPGYLGIAAGSFLDGYERMEGIKARKKEAEERKNERIYQRKRDAIMDARYRAQLEREDARYQDTLAYRQGEQKYRDKRDAVGDARWQATQDYQTKRDAIGDDRWSQTHALDQEKHKSTMALNQANIDLATKRLTLADRELSAKEKEWADSEETRRLANETVQFELDTKRGEQDRAAKRRGASAGLQGVRGEQSKLDMRAAQNMWGDFLKGDGKVDYAEMREVLAETSGIDFMSVLSPEAEGHIERMMRFLNGDAGMALTDKRVAESFNYFWQPGLNKGVGEKTEDGKEIIHKEVSHVVPGKQPGTIALLLDVTTYNPLTDEIETYQAPATEGARSAKDENVLQIPADEIIQNIVGVAKLREETDQLGARRDEYLAQYEANREDGTNPYTGLSGAAEWDSTNKVWTDADTMSVYGAGGVNDKLRSIPDDQNSNLNPGAEVNLLNYIASAKFNGDKSQALDYLKDMRKDPITYEIEIQKLIEGRIKGDQGLQVLQMMMMQEEDDKERNKLMKRYNERVSEIRKSLTGQFGLRMNVGSGPVGPGSNQIIPPADTIPGIATSFSRVAPPQ